MQNRLTACCIQRQTPSVRPGIMSFCKQSNKHACHSVLRAKAPAQTAESIVTMIGIGSMQELQVPTFSAALARRAGKLHLKALLDLHLHLRGVSTGLTALSCVSSFGLPLAHQVAALNQVNSFEDAGSFNNRLSWRHMSITCMQLGRMGTPVPWMCGIWTQEPSSIAQAVRSSLDSLQHVDVQVLFMRHPFDRGHVTRYQCRLVPQARVSIAHCMPCSSAACAARGPSIQPGQCQGKLWSCFCNHN